MFRLSIKTDNAAFHSEVDGKDAGPGAELARILRIVADDLEQSSYNDSAVLIDSNGNTVGEYSLKGA
jgi:hypothetical protein